MGERFFTITQFVLSCIMFVCTSIGVIAHISKGNITSFIGFIVAFILLVLTWYLLRISWKEMREECNK